MSIEKELLKIGDIPNLPGYIYDVAYKAVVAIEQLRKDVHGQAQAKIQLGRLLHEEKAGTYK